MTRILASGAAFGLALGLASSAFAQGANTSGPATGGNVQPSTAVQKDNPSAQNTGGTTAPATAAGAPGTEARPGTQGGAAPAGQAPTK